MKLTVKKSHISIVATIVSLLCVLHLVGCSSMSYVTPGGGVSLANISDGNIAERFETKPASPFPATLAVVRIQESGYYSYRCSSHGHGPYYSIVTADDIETQEHFDKIASMPMVAGLARINRMLLPPNWKTVKDIRIAAASLHADMILLYTLDTSFNVRGQDIGPLSLISLGFLPNKKAYVTTTASAVLVDVRTGYIYGLAEGTARESKIASHWSSEDAIDNSRVKTEKAAFDELISELKVTWAGVVGQYSAGSRISTKSNIYRTY